MNQIKEHIIFKLITLFLVVIFFAPSAVKFSHVFTHHKHDICLGGNTTHIHKVDLDCDFQKFQLNNNFTINISCFELFLPQLKITESIPQYLFLNKRDTLNISLRAPPSLV